MEKINKIRGKTIKKIDKIDAKWRFNGGNSYTEPASIEIVFDDGTKCKITASEKGDTHSGEHPYIDLDISIFEK